MTGLIVCDCLQQRAGMGTDRFTGSPHRGEGGDGFPDTPFEKKCTCKFFEIDFANVEVGSRAEALLARRLANIGTWGVVSRTSTGCEGTGL